MKWLIIEDALRDRKGHWLEYVSTFVQGLKELGDEVVVLCDRKAEGFVMEQTGALPVMPESIWHRMGDGAGAVKRYLRVPEHALATFLVMRKFFRSFNHGLHNRAPRQARDGATEGWPEGRGSGNERVKLTRMGREQINAQGTCAGAAFSNPFASKLARDSENTSPTCTASAPAEEALRAEMQRSGNIEPRMARIYTDGQQGDAQGTCAGAAFSNPSTSELARDCEDTSPTRGASAPAEEALRAEMQRSGNIEPRMARIYTDGQQGDAQGTCAGDAFSNPSTSELTRASENTSLTRCASGSSEEALRADDMGSGSAVGNQFADSMEFLKGQSQAGLQMDNQKLPTIRTANDPSASGEYSSSVPIRDIRGSNSVALDSGPSPLDSGEAPDWIFVPTVLVHHLLGWWTLLKTGSLPRESRVLLFFPNLPIRLDHMGLAHWSGGPTTKLMAWLFGQLRNEVESGRVVLGVETHAMRRALEGLIQMPVVYLPHPVEASTTGLQGETTNHTNLHERGRQGDAQGTCAGASEPGSLASKLADSPVSESPTRSASAIPCFDPRPSSLDSRPKSPATSAKPIVFGCYGAARWEKGSDIFQEAIRLVLDGAISTTKCTKGHEKGGGISTAIERQGGREKEQSKFGPKGEGVGMTKSNNSGIHGWGDAGLCLDKPSGAAFSNPSTSELARDSENISPSRSASAPADALRADHTGLGSAGGNQLADSKDFLEGQSQAGLQMDNQKDPIIRTANDPSASGEYSSSVLIREIRGQNSSSSETSHSALASSLAATAAGRPLRFAIQWVEDFQDEKGNLVQLDPWLKKHPQVEVIGRFFEGDEYERRLAATDVMVLPYRKPYRLRVSRVVIEAMMNGMPVIATRGTTLFEQAEEYGVAIGCEEGSAESLAEAILKAAENFEIMRVSAREKADAAAQSFSVGFFRDLLGRDGQKLSTLDAGPSSLHFK